MRSPITALLVALALASAPTPVEAQVGSHVEVTVRVGRLATIPVTMDADRIEYEILGPALDGFREFEATPKRLRIRVIAYEVGTGYVVVLGVKDGVPALHVVTVHMVAGPGPKPPVPPGPIPPVPPPNPPIPPPTPGPTDPFTRAIIDAYKADSSAMKAAALVQVLGFYQAVTDHLRDPNTKTVDAFLTTYRDVAAKLLPPGELMAVRKLIGEKVAGLFPADGDAVIDDPTRTKAVAFFQLVSTAMEACRK